MILRPPPSRSTGVPLFDIFPIEPTVWSLTGEVSPDTERRWLSDSNRKIGVAQKKSCHPTTRPHPLPSGISESEPPGLTSQNLKPISRL